MRIDYSKRWQHQHWMSILSAYRNSPYFDHYRDRFEPFYNREFTFLADWNIALLETVTGILGTPPALRFSDSYIEADTDDRDLRPAFEPLRANGRTTAGGVYEQVFADRFPFVPNLSVIDLLFCEALRRKRSSRSLNDVCPPQKNPAPVCGCRTVVSVCSPIYRWAARYTS